MNIRTKLSFSELESLQAHCALRTSICADGSLPDVVFSTMSGGSQESDQRLWMMFAFETCSYVGSFSDSPEGLGHVALLACESHINMPESHHHSSQTQAIGLPEVCCLFLCGTAHTTLPQLCRTCRG
jgi:hypothetical protein